MLNYSVKIIYPSGKTKDINGEFGTSGFLDKESLNENGTYAFQLYFGDYLYQEEKVKMY